MSSNSLANKVALITGSSKGIGSAIAKRLAVDGADVILHGRTVSAELEQTAGSVRELNRQVNCLTCDFSDVTSISQFANDAWKLHGRIDILVNNAGGDVLTGEKAEKSALDKLDYLYSSDCRSTFQISRLIGSRMKQTFARAGEARIVNIGWDQSFQGMAGESGEMFAAIKGSIMSMSLSLAQSLAPIVRVNCVAPGWIKTQWGEQTSDYWTNRAESESLMNRWGTPSDIANAVSFLVSDQASFISGQILNVNGGFRFNQSIRESRD